MKTYKARNSEPVPGNEKRMYSAASVRRFDGRLDRRHKFRHAGKLEPRYRALDGCRNLDKRRSEGAGLIVISVLSIGLLSLDPQEGSPGPSVEIVGLQGSSSN